MGADITCSQTAYFGAFVPAETLVVSAAGAGTRLGGLLVVIVKGIDDVPERLPGVLDGAGVVGVAAGGTAGGDAWGAFPRYFSNVLLLRL